MKKLLLAILLLVLGFLAGWCSRENRADFGILATGRFNTLITWHGATDSDSVRREILAIILRDDNDLVCRMGERFVFASWKGLHKPTVASVIAALERNPEPSFEYAITRYEDDYEKLQPDTRRCAP